MPTYLVRTIEGHDLVGIFVTPSVIALAMLVDDCTDPVSWEYLRMKPAGVMWTVRAGSRSSWNRPTNSQLDRNSALS